MIRRIFLLSGSISLSVFGAFTVAHATTINVTTLQDEDGENLNSCSLREAIKASGSKAAYGGCKAGQRDYTDTVQLTTGTYTLTKGELVVKGDMVLLGGADVDIFLSDPITGTSPKRPAVVTKIVAANGSRIFNSTASNDQINLSNMILSGGVADIGGSIRAGGSVTLNRVQINGATANKQGGAIYLEGAQSTLTAVSSSFAGNNAPSGAVLGMSCFDNILPTVRTITLSQLSITQNGLSGTSSILDFCGDSTSTITGSTIAQNTAQNTDVTGFSPAIVRFVGDINTRLGKNSTLGLISNTVVENNADVVFAYSKPSAITITSNILGFNNSSLDCKYIGPNDPATNLPPSSTQGSFNLFSAMNTPGTASGSKCKLYPAASTEKDTNIYSDSTSVLSDFVSPLGLYASSDLPGYLPKATTSTVISKIIDKGNSTLLCGATDQRGLGRSSGVKLTGVGQVVNCDIGALELSVLTANDDIGGINASYDTVVNTVVDTTGLTASQIKTINENNKSYLNAYKTSYRYREVVMDIVANDFAQESASGNTSVLDLLTDSTKYTITGSDSANGNIHCEWNPVMKQMLASRRDGAITPSGETDTCNYTIKDLASGGETKTGKISFIVSNLPPIAKNDTFILTFGTKSIPLDILANDTDDGDGPVGVKNYPAGKTPFYIDKRLVNGVIVEIPLNIRFVTMPTQGKIVAQYEGPCPDNNVNTAQTTCYGGKLTYVNNNLFSPFNDSFTYQVLDSDLTASAPATVTITNTATTTDKEKAGGGSFGLGALLGMLSLVFIRRRMAN